MSEIPISLSLIAQRRRGAISSRPPAPRFTLLRFDPPALRRLCGFILIGAAVIGALGSASRVTAFPPAPFYTLYGVVRDQVGATLNVQGAELILLKENVEVGRTPIADARSDQNYELKIRVDQTRTNSRIYTTRAVGAKGLYSLAVDMNGERFYPIEVTGTLRVGEGGERVRLDLNLGADSNHDGLPDAWQEWQLFQAGRVRNTPGWNIDLITRDGDFDGDGVSNFEEYVAGTFAGDATERFELKITGKDGPTLSFEFFSITGKLYGLEQSSDLVTWTPVGFSLTPTGPVKETFRATEINVVPAYVTGVTDESRFYRLTVR